MKSLLMPFITTTVLMLAPSVVSADSPDEAWVSFYNGPGNNYDYARDIAVDAAGNVFVTGDSHGGGTGQDYATIKYNSEGVQQWVARYNGPGDGDDYARSIAVDAAGNVYVTGESWGGYGTYNDYATIKYNSAGVQQWVARYNGPNSAQDYAKDIVVDAAGNVFVTGGASGAGYATIKYNSAGVQQWVATYYFSANAQEATALAIVLDAAGNIYVTGASYGSDTFADFATVRYNSTGVQQWVARYNGPGNYTDEANAIALDAAGNVFVTGSSKGIGTGLDYATLKYNSAGVQQWVERYNGPGNDSDSAYDIAVDAAGNVYVTGESIGSGTSYDYATLKYNSSGGQQWVSRYEDQYVECARAIALDAAGGVYVTGYHYTIKYSSSGVQQWAADPGLDNQVALGFDAAGNVYVTGYRSNSGSSYDYMTIRYNSSVGITEGDQLVVPELQVSVSPNPATSYASVIMTLTDPSECVLQIYSLDGRLVETLHNGTLPGGESSLFWQTSQVPPGLYLLRVNIGSLVASSRIVVMR